MLWSTSVLSTLSSDTEPSVVIAFDSAKYLFNVGENTTRSYLQSRQTWRKTRGLFLTSIGTQRTSGLPGLLMTFADAGRSQVRVTGPSGLLHLIASMRRYTYRDNLDVTPSEVPLVPDDQPVYKDENITVFALPINPTLEESYDEDALDCSGNADGHSKVLKRKRDTSPERPVKRGSNNQARTSPEPDPSVSIDELMERSDFDPTSLRGDRAQAWRRHIVKLMFPATRVPESTGLGDKNQKGRQKGKENTIKPSPDEHPSTEYVQQPLGLKRPLPVPDSSLVGFSDQRLRPTLAYAIHGPRIRGKFDAQKAEALGLKRGPLRAVLARGQTVTVKVDDGCGNSIDSEIKPSDCIGEGTPPGIVLLLDIPTLAHIPSLLAGFADGGPFAKYRQLNSKDHDVRVIHHLCGDGVLEDERYRALMNEFGPDVHHLVASRRYLPDPVTFTSAAYSQLRLKQLDSDIFPTPKFTLSAEKALEGVAGLPARTLAMQAGLSVSIHPPRSPAQDENTRKLDLFHPAVCSDSLVKLPDPILSSFSRARAVVQSFASDSEADKIPGKDVLVCTLGTGSAIPSKFRNVSATLIHIPKHGYLLLDAGEGTWGQLVRKYGRDPSSPSNVWQMLRELKCIFISHIHGDHHIGLAKLLAMRQRLDPPSKDPLYLVANYTVFQYLRDYDSLEMLGLQNGSDNPVMLIPADAIHWLKSSHSEGSNRNGSRPWYATAHADLCTSLGLRSLQTVDVEHRTLCHGLIIKHTDDWSIVYSGDTVPVHRLVQAGQNATLLIHEATMADDEADKARAKMHSTVGQAIDIGKQMNAYSILLTHFSARYPTMPQSMLTNCEPGEPIVALAFDHANVRIGDMRKMHAYMPAIEQNFAELDDDDATAQVAEVDIT
ncbi:hypothetical protein BKA83DRAFT_4370844 [Pisolithus microcarpus]|nr:hypothetical protein BKA83DRAFT_4370844 [Pisolithus microcarpus]